MIARVLLSLVLLALASHAHANPVLHLCQDDVDVYPWHITNGQGLSNLMLEMVSKRLGQPIEIESMPWKRCLALVEKNQMDGAVAASFRPERMAIGAYPLSGPDKADASRRMSDETYVFFVRKDDPQAPAWNGKQLGPISKPVAAQLGYSAVGLLRERGIAVDDSDKRPDLLLRKLLLGQVSAAVLNARQGEQLLKDPAFAGKIIRLEPPLQTREGYLLISHDFARQYPEVTRRVWDEIAKVRESVDYQRELLKMLDVPR